MQAWKVFFVAFFLMKSSSCDQREFMVVIMFSSLKNDESTSSVSICMLDMLHTVTFWIYG